MEVSSMCFVDVSSYVQTGSQLAQMRAKSFATREIFSIGAIEY